jgi:hypothetical protein
MQGQLEVIAPVLPFVTAVGKDRIAEEDAQAKDGSVRCRKRCSRSSR